MLSLKIALYITNLKFKISIQGCRVIKMAKCNTCYRNPRLAGKCQINLPEEGK